MDAFQWVGERSESLPYGVAVMTLLYLALAAFVKQYASVCFGDPKECLANGVDNSTSSILTGLVASLGTFAFALHLIHVKHHSHASKLGVRDSGIKALIFSSIGIFLQTLARILQPNQSLGNPIFWSLWSYSYLYLVAAIYCHGIFAMQTIGKKLNICSSCKLISLTTGLIFIIGVLATCAGLSCAILRPPIPQLDYANKTNSSLQTTQDKANIFLHSRIRLSEETIIANDRVNYHGGAEFDFAPYTPEHSCQSTVYYSGYAFDCACFLFWCFCSRVLVDGTFFKSEEVIDGCQLGLRLMGLSTINAVTLVPWVSFSVGNLYPVWIWIVSALAGKNTLQASESAYEGIVYHYGLLLMAMLAHNWSYTLTLTDVNNQKDEESWTEGVFHDLRLGCFEEPLQSKISDWSDTSDEESRPSELGDVYL